MEETIEELLQSYATGVQKLGLLGAKSLFGREVGQAIESLKVKLLLHLGLERSHAGVSVADVEAEVSWGYDLDVVVDPATILGGVVNELNLIAVTTALFYHLLLLFISVEISL